jgi:2-polyprenyl-3-methyl-5-hydroxy-6-metoxy-1,4-benzoquinol methylase
MAQGLPKEQEERWREEASFFDEKAADTERALAQPIDPLVLQRYTGRLRKRFYSEFRFRLLGDVRGKTLLDVGCGLGSNSVLLAKLGARVTGIDISPKSIEVAGKRAEAAGVGANCRFLCSPLETAPLAPGSFDIIWGEAILHHLIPELPLILGKLVECTKPGGWMIFGEPVNLNQTLRRIRLAMPVSTDATPDERPLEPAELDIVRRYVTDLHLRTFSFLSRVERFVLVDWSYEHSAPWRRTTVNALAALDYLVLSLPGIQRLGGNAVLYGHPRTTG